MNLLRVILFPIAFLLATYWVCYQIFSWALIDERAQRTHWMREGQTPISDAAELLRDVLTGLKGT